MGQIAHLFSELMIWVSPPWNCRAIFSHFTEWGKISADMNRCWYTGRQKKGEDTNVDRKLECLALLHMNFHWSLTWGLCDSNVSQIIWSTVRRSLSQLWSLPSATENDTRCCWANVVSVTADNILVSTITQPKTNEEFSLRNELESVKNSGSNRTKKKKWVEPSFNHLMQE